MKITSKTRVLAVAAGALLLAGLFSGCGKFENPLSPTVDKEALAPKKPKVVSVEQKVNKKLDMLDEQQAKLEKKDKKLSKREKALAKKREKIEKKSREARKEHKKEKADKRRNKKDKQKGLLNAYLGVVKNGSETAFVNIVDKLIANATLVTPAGGVVATYDSSAKLIVPPGALTDSTPIFIIKGEQRGHFRGEFKSIVYNFEPSGLTFNTPATVEFHYSADDAAFDLQPAYYDKTSDYWVLLPYKKDVANNIITIQISHFSSYALIDPYPSAPANLSGKINNDGSVDLKWLAPDDNDIIGYNVYRDGVKINKLLIPSAGVTDVGLINGVSYNYTVTAVDGSANESVHSDTYTAVAVDEVPPSAPVLDGYGDSTKIVLLWDTCTQPDFAGFWVRYNDIHYLNKTAIFTTTATDYSLPEYTNRYYYILSVDKSGNVSKSNVLKLSLSYDADKYTPGAPTNLTGAVSDGQISLIWDTASYKYLEGYHVYMDGLSVEIVKAPANVCTVAVENGVRHSFYVTTRVNVDGLWPLESEPSNTIYLTAVDNNPPLPPSNLKAPLVGDNFINISWDRSKSTDVKGYNVYVNSLFRAFVSDPYYKITDTVNKVDYTITVAALDSSNNESISTSSITAQSVDMEIPVAPTELTVTSVGDNLAEIRWNAVKPVDFAMFKVYRDGVFIAQTTEMSFKEEGLTNNTNYSYTVTMVDDDANESSKSNSVTAIPLDNVAPAAVSWITPVYNDRAVTLKWNTVALNEDATSCKDLTGYALSITSKSFNKTVILSSTATEYTVEGLDYDVIYNCDIAAFDDDGNTSAISSLQIIPKDIIPPAAPSGLAAAADYNSVHLTWTPNTEADLGGYNVYRDGVKVNTGIVTSAKYDDAGLEAGKSYQYYVTAVDIRGNESLASATIIGSTYQAGQEYTLWTDGSKIGGTGQSSWIGSGYPAFDTNKFYEWTGSAPRAHVVLAMDGYVMANPDMEYVTSAQEIDIIIKFPEVRRVSRIHFNTDGNEPFTFDYSVYYSTDNTDYNTMNDALSSPGWKLVDAPNAVGSDGNFKVQRFPGVRIYDWTAGDQNLVLANAVYTKYIRIHMKRTSSYNMFMNYIYIYN